MKNSETPAFASVAYGDQNDSYCQEGLTKREYFAAMAMQGIIANQELRLDIIMDGETVSENAVMFADELLKQLEK